MHGGNEKSIQNIGRKTLLTRETKEQEGEDIKCISEKGVTGCDGVK